MDLNFYSDLTDGTGPHDGDPQFLDPQSFNGFDTDSKVTPSCEWAARHHHTRTDTVRAYSDGLMCALNAPPRALVYAYCCF